MSRVANHPEMEREDLDYAREVMVFLQCKRRIFFGMFIQFMHQGYLNAQRHITCKSVLVHADELGHRILGCQSTPLIRLNLLLCNPGLQFLQCPLLAIRA